jgi:hypothetical protein
MMQILFTCMKRPFSNFRPFGPFLEDKDLEQVVDTQNDMTGREKRRKIQALADRDPENITDEELEVLPTFPVSDEEKVMLPPQTLK